MSWFSRKQLCVALSTAEAEYVALASATQEAVWLRELSKVFGCNQVGAMVIFEDNQAAIEIAKNPQFHGRMKHIEIKYHFTRDQVDKKAVCLEYRSSENMPADILTKGVSREKHLKLTTMLGVSALY